MSAPRVVVVLGGGGAKAAAHLGAARALREAGVVPVRWIGTSMGAVMAVALATGEDPAAILDRMLAVRRGDVLVTDWPSVLRGVWARQLLKPRPLKDTIARLVQVQSFAALRTACTVTATEVKTGREVAFGTDGEDAPVADVLAATCALPPYFPPAQVNGRDFYDGGLSAPVPLRQAATIACDVVIAIHAGPGFDETGVPQQSPPPLVAAADTAIGWLMAANVDLMRERWAGRAGAPRLVWLRPVHDRGATFAMERAPGYADAGYRSMSGALKEIL